MSNIKIFRLDNGYGLPLVCRLLEKGDHYGAYDCLTLERDTPTLEFYDARHQQDYAFCGTDEEAKEANAECLGQFISRYFLTTLEESLESMQGGLCLHGGVPDWVISKEQLAKSVDQATMRLKFEETFPLRVGELSAYIADGIFSDDVLSVSFYEWAKNAGRGFPAMHCQIAIAANAGERRLGAEWFLGSREYLEDAEAAAGRLVRLREEYPTLDDDQLAVKLWDTILNKGKEDQT